MTFVKAEFAAMVELLSVEKMPRDRVHGTRLPGDAVAIEIMEALDRRAAVLEEKNSSQGTGRRRGEIDSRIAGEMQRRVVSSQVETDAVALDLRVGVDKELPILDEVNTRAERDDGVVEDGYSATVDARINCDRLIIVYLVAEVAIWNDGSRNSRQRIGKDGTSDLGRRRIVRSAAGCAADDADRPPGGRVDRPRLRQVIPLGCKNL